MEVPVLPRTTLPMTSPWPPVNFSSFVLTSSPSLISPAQSLKPKTVKHLQENTWGKSLWSWVRLKRLWYYTKSINHKRNENPNIPNVIKRTILFKIRCEDKREKGRKIFPKYISNKGFIPWVMNSPNSVEQPI